MSKKADINRIINIMHKYFPTGLAYDTDQYYNTEQYYNRMNLVNTKFNSGKGEQYRHELKNLFPEYAVVDWSERDSVCYEYKVLLHKNQELLDDDIELMKSLGGIRHDLRVFISILGPYYYMFIEKTHYDFLNEKWTFITIDEEFNKSCDAYRKATELFDNSGLSKIDNTVANLQINGVETELKHLGEATLFNCLFTDMVDIVIK